MGPGPSAFSLSEWGKVRAISADPLMFALGRKRIFAAQKAT